ncbi:MAG: flagellar hook-length control protein FliK [Nitrospinaceae bacterium]
MLSDNLSPNTLRPIFSHALSLKLEIIKLEAFIQNYSTGQTLAGKVVQVLPEQKAVVELQGEKLLLQFPRPVNPGQNIAIKIEQIHPSPILKLTEFSSLTSSQKIAPGNLAKVGAPLNTPESDKTSIQYRSADSLSGTPVPGAENGQAAPDTKVTNPLTKAVLKARAPLDKRVTTAPLSKTDLKPLGIEGGQKVKAEVIRVVDRETVQVRFNDNAVTIRYAASQKLQLGEPIYLHAKPIPSGKFVLEVEQIPIPSVTVRPPLEMSVLKNYLPTRQPLIQVLAGLKEVFLEGPLTQLKELNIDPAQLKQLQANLQRIIFREFKAPDAAQLKEMIDRSGFHYEAKVKDFVLEPGLSNKNVLLENDLKGQLMRLARQLEQIPAGATESTASEKFTGKLMAQVSQAVSNIELQQLTHHFAKEEQHPLLLQLPENLLGEEDRFKIYIFPDQREDAGQESDFHNRIFNLVFLLNLSALGDLRIETKIFKDEISIHITGSNSDAVQFIQAHVPELEDLFQEVGFSISVTSQHQTEVSMEVPDSLGQLLIDTPLQMVDLKT